MLRYLVWVPTIMAILGTPIVGLYVLFGEVPPAALALPSVMAGINVVFIMFVSMAWMDLQ